MQRKNKAWGVCIMTACLAFAGCERRSEVTEETKELQEARQDAPNVAAQLEKQLKDAKGEVVRLEEKLAMARQGVTDEVVEQRNDLKEALKTEDQHVREEVNEAQHAAQALNNDSERARRALEQSQTNQRVEATVKTETQAIPTQNGVQVQREQQAIPIERTRVVEERVDTQAQNAGH